MTQEPAVDGPFAAIPSRRQALVQLERELDQLQANLAALRTVERTTVLPRASAPAATRTAGGARTAAASALKRGAASNSPLVRATAGAALTGIRRARGRRTGYLRAGRAPVGIPLARDLAAADQDLISRLQQRNGIVVVIPVFNAAAALERCLRSVFTHTRLPYRLLIMDDGSTDPAIAPLMERAGRHPHVEVVRSQVNRGFTPTVNAAFDLTGEDVVLLNSDTEVGPGWLEGLLVAAHQSDHVATATPLSDNAGAFSAPSVGTDNPLPAGMDIDTAARLVRRTSQRLYPRVPTGHGFCMYIRRRALEQVGHFDAVSFPRGYGEENDFCARASAAGFEHVLDDATYIRHERSASFGPEKAELLRAGRARIDQLHPGYTGAVRGFLADPIVTRTRENVRDALNPPLEPVRPRAMFVLHSGSGGTPATNLDLMRRVSSNYECFTLTALAHHLEVHRLVGRDLVLEQEVRLEQEWRVTDVTRTDYRHAVTRLLLELGIDLVHIRHLMGHTLELPIVCRSLGIPVVLSFHDFYLSCPTVHLVDNNDRFCAGRCTAGPGACRLSSRSMRGVPPLKHEWVHVWRQHVAAAFDHVDVFVTTSQAARKVMERSHPALACRRFVVVPHGRDLAEGNDACAPPSRDQPVRVLFTGNVGAHKGAALIRRLAELDGGRRLDLHFLGKTAPELFDVGTHHGEYDREDFPRIVQDIRPSFIGVFAIWAETYSHTLTEAWSVGVPVLASDIGVLRERVDETGAGWCIDPYDAERAYEQILAAAADPDEHRRRRRAARDIAPRSTEDMADDYRAIYAPLLHGSAW